MNRTTIIVLVVLALVAVGVLFFFRRPGAAGASPFFNPFSPAPIPPSPPPQVKSGGASFLSTAKSLHTAGGTAICTAYTKGADAGLCGTLAPVVTKIYSTAGGAVVSGAKSIIKGIGSLF